MNHEDHIGIENASLRAWPAREQFAESGWVVRISDGYTGRANSATLLHLRSDSISEFTLDRIEQAYRDRGRPVLLRLLSFAHPEELDRLLAQRGYRVFNNTMVMSRPLETRYDLPVDLRVLDLDQGLAAHTQMRGLSPDTAAAHRAILERIANGLAFLGLFHRNELVACGCSVIEAPFAGLFDIVTSPNHRRKGHARAMLCAMLDRAIEQEAKTAYLQVVAANEPAIALYSSLGFEPAYTYHYWTRDR